MDFDKGFAGAGDGLGGIGYEEGGGGASVVLDCLGAVREEEFGDGMGGVLTYRLRALFCP